MSLGKLFTYIHSTGSTFFNSLVAVLAIYFHQSHKSNYLHQERIFFVPDQVFRHIEMAFILFRLLKMTVSGLLSG